MEREEWAHIDAILDRHFLVHEQEVEASAEAVKHHCLLAVLGHLSFQSALLQQHLMDHLGAIRDEFIAAGLDECLMKLLGPEVVLRLINQLATRELRKLGVKSMIVGVISHGPGAVRDEFITAEVDESLMKLLSPEVVLRLINQLVVA
nr:two-component response regulator ARR22-like [Ipomoea trifida]